MKHSQFALWSLTASAWATGPAQYAAAQAEQPLDEIVVTAQKRSEKLQDVPISISAVSGASLDRQGSPDFRNVLLSIPGLSYSNSEPGQSNYSIRGVSTGASSPTTGIYLDDVSLITLASGFAGTVDPPIFDLERIEVLKGPQGTLYGGSAMGGAIKYVTHKPELDAFSVSAAGGVEGTDGGGLSYNGESVANLPLVDGKLAMRIGVLYRDEAGYINYLPNAQGQFLNQSATVSPPAAFVPQSFASGGTLGERNVNEVQNTSGRVALRFVGENGLEILPSATFQRIYEADPPDFWTNLSDLNASYRTSQPLHDDLDFYSLNVTQPFGWSTLTSLTGYSDRTRDFDRDYSYFVAGLVPGLLGNDSANASDTKTTTFSEELRLASADTSTVIKWVAGAFYSRQNDTLKQVVDTMGAGAFFDSGTDIVYSGVQSTHTTQVAVFGDVTYSITQQWDASVGLRWFDIDQTYTGVFNGVFNGGSTLVPDKQSADVGVNPKFSLSYHPAEDHLVYASASKGFRPGGPNRFNTASPLCGPDFAKLGIASAPASFTSDSLWTYEIGSKNEFAGGRILVNGAVYYTDWKKVQQEVNLPTCGFQFTANVGAAKIKGVELEFKAPVTAFATVGLSGNYTHSEVTETEPGVSAQVGQPLLDTPRWTGDTFVEFNLPEFAGWTSKLRTDYAYHGSNLRQFDSTVAVALPTGATGVVPDVTQVQRAYEVGNVALQAAHGAWDANLYLNNFTNAEPFLDYNRLLNTPNATTLRPRTVGLLLRVKFQ